MSLLESISQLRRDFKKDDLSINTLEKSPFDQFSLWFEDALKAEFLDPNAMTLSTTNKDGRPSSRILLLKNYDENGFVFYTNYESRKGEDLAENPYASMLFYWDKLERQIRINGKCEKISKEESNAYFQTRDKTSRLGAWASQQSRELSSRMSLMKDVAKYMAKYPKDIPLPPYWGGYRIVPDQIEFWQGRESRLHDRFQYNLLDGEWTIKRLYP